jgi:NAD(P)H-dependent flavin oxidoreductase YrpB (nitropropane dioxygenase family)
MDAVASVPFVAAGGIAEGRTVAAAPALGAVRVSVAIDPNQTRADSFGH